MSRHSADSTAIKFVYQTHRLDCAQQGYGGKRVAEFGNRGAVAGPAIAKSVISIFFRSFSTAAAREVE